MGFGFNLSDKIDNDTIGFVQGTMPGFSCAFVVAPTKNSSLIVLTNSDKGMKVIMIL